MADGRGWLSRTLRSLRPEGMSASAAARSAGMSQPRISRIETGVLLPTADEIRRLCTLYGAPAEIRRELTEAAAALRPGTTPARAVITRGGWKMQLRIARAERDADEICGYQPALILGLLQTADYARLVLGDGGLIAGDDLDRAVGARLGRAAVLNSGRRIALIMAEGALRWQAGSQAVMRDQLEYLAELITTWPQARIGIIPQSRPATVFTTHGFSMYDRATVTVGFRTGTSFIRDPADVAEYADLFSELEQLAMFGEDAIQVISEVASSYRG